MDDATILKEGTRSEFWRIICAEIDKRIESAKTQLETQSNIEMIKRLQFAIAVSREFKNLPKVLLTHANSQAKEKEK